MRRNRDRVRRDSAGFGPDPTLTGRLYRLSDKHDYRIASGEPDIRGWEVRTLSGQDVGEVDDLLIDPNRSEVVMIDVDLKDSHQHVNVPIRGVQIDRERHCVVVDSGDIRTARESFVSGGVESERERDRLDDRTEDARDEVVVDRKPIIEETIIRRRAVESEED